MTKRAFLKLSAGLLAGPPGPLITTQQAGGPAPGSLLTNWAGNYQYSTASLRHPASVEELRKFIADHSALKVLGTRHCFNGLADSTHALIALDAMNEVVAIDPQARTVTVAAGMTYGQLCPYLQARGFALHNLASLPHISIVGACATATHGSGINNGNLATAVCGLELITAAGDALKLSRARDGETMLGSVVNLGALGVVTAITLVLEPSFMVKQQVYENLPLAQLADHFDSIMSGGYSVSLFTDWQKKRINQVWVKSRVGAADPAGGNPASYGAKPATRNLHPIAELGAENCTEPAPPGPWYERLPHFRMGFTPSSGKELQSEYFVSRNDAVEAILAVERLRARIAPHLQISELRTVNADRLWMSPCYNRPSLAIHFTWKQDWGAVRQLLPLIEKELTPYAPRPHWGKLFTIEPTHLRSRYERLGDFKELVRLHDPHGKFRNKFLASNLYD